MENNLSKGMIDSKENLITIIKFLETHNYEEVKEMCKGVIKAANQGEESVNKLAKELGVTISVNGKSTVSTWFRRIFGFYAMESENMSGYRWEFSARNFARLFHGMPYESYRWAKITKPTKKGIIKVPNSLLYSFDKPQIIRQFSESFEIKTSDSIQEYLDLVVSFPIALQNWVEKNEGGFAQ